MRLKYLHGASCALCTKLLLLSETSWFSYINDSPSPREKIWYAVKRNSDFLAAFWNKGRLAFKLYLLDFSTLISFKYNAFGYGFSVQISMFSLFVPLCYQLHWLIVSEILKCFSKIASHLFQHLSLMCSRKIHVPVSRKWTHSWL